MHEASPVRLLGRIYSPIQKDEIQEQIKNIIWFSYREKIPPLLKDKFPNKSYTSDRGWGCMLRCGQMMLGEAIQRHLLYHKTFAPEFRKDAQYSAISLFCDSITDPEISPFSIQQISREAYEYFGLKPGEWYKASNIMGTLNKLHQKHTSKALKNFKIVNFVDGTIFEDQILKAAIDDFELMFPDKEEGDGDHGEKSEEGDQKEEEKKPEEEKNDKEKEQTSPNMAWDTSIFVFVATKTGLDHHNEIYLPTILHMMTIPQNIGILSGKDARAYYYIGFQNDTVLYLDPHFVQDAPTDLGDLLTKFPSYFVEKSFQMPLYDMDTSIAFGFYIADEKEYLEFKEILLKKISNDPNFLVGFERETPNLDFNNGDILEVQDNDGSFEIIQ